MRADCKYIVWRDTSGDETLERFGAALIHADYVARQGIRRTDLVSAGYMTADGECFGASSSLRLSSRPAKDSALARGDD